MSCIPCSKIPTTYQSTLKYYKDLYKEKDIVHYVYRLSTNSSVFIIEKQYFSKVLEEEIKPNFKNGAEYFHISEFNV